VVDGQAVVSGGAAIEVCILAGGLSTRMGRDKARIRVGGITMLTRIRATAARAFPPASARVRVLRKDRVRRCGPLGGIISALRTTHAPTVLFLACDMPLISPALLKKIVRAGDDVRAAFALQRGRVGFPFVLPVHSRELIEKQMATGEFSLQALAHKLRGRRVLVATSNRELFNVNTPSDITVAEQLLTMNERLACH